MTPRDWNVNATNGLVLRRLRNVAPTNHIGTSLVVHARATTASDAFELFARIRIGVIPTTRLPLAAVADFQAQVCAEIDTSGPTSVGGLHEKLAISLVILRSRFAEYFGRWTAFRSTRTGYAQTTPCATISIGLAFAATITGGSDWLKLERWGLHALAADDLHAWVGRRL